MQFRNGCEILGPRASCQTAIAERRPVAFPQAVSQHHRSHLAAWYAAEVTVAKILQILTAAPLTLDEFGFCRGSIERAESREDSLDIPPSVLTGARVAVLQVLHGVA